MLWILASVLFAFWVLGLALKVTTGLIHLALGFFRGRRSTTAVP